MSYVVLIHLEGRGLRRRDGDHYGRDGDVDADGFRGADDVHDGGAAAATYPLYLEREPTCKVNDALSDFLSDVPVGWEDRTAGAPDWLRAMCPEVVDHFDAFPSFGEYRTFLNVSLPMQTTDYAAHAVCTTKVVQLMASSVNARVYLHAVGTEQGAEGVSG